MPIEPQLVIQSIGVGDGQQGEGRAKMLMSVTPQIRWIAIQTF
jgi:hypothetical protein